MKTPTRILVCRTDRLGDVLLSLPALDFLRRSFPEGEVDLLVRPEYRELLTPYLGSRHIGVLPYTKEGSWRAVLRDWHYRAAVVLFDEPGLAFSLWRAGVTSRIGAYSKPRSFLFLTGGLRQSRGRAEKNEAEYNLDLAYHAAGKFRPGTSVSIPPAIRFPVNQQAADLAVQVLVDLGLGRGESFSVVHPGMGGSALNFPVAGYLRGIEQLQAQGRVFLSLGPSAADKELGTEVRGARPDLPVIEGQSLSVLSEIFRLAKAVMAPSTGPLHLAHYVGTTTIGVYSPVRTHSPKRWAPWGGAGKSLILAPAVACPGVKDCLGKACPHYYCMDVMAGGGLPSTLLSALNDSTGG